MKNLDKRLKNLEARAPNSELSASVIRTWCVEQGIATPEPIEGESSNHWWARVSGDALLAIARAVNLA